MAAVTAAAIMVVMVVVMVARISAAAIMVDISAVVGAISAEDRLSATIVLSPGTV